MMIEDIEKRVGPLFEAVRDRRCDPTPVQYVTEHIPGLYLYLQPESKKIEFIQGGSVEKDGQQILKLGMSSKDIRDLLGAPSNTSLHRRQFWHYRDLGLNHLNLELMLDNSVLTGIETIWEP